MIPEKQTEISKNETGVIAKSERLRSLRTDILDSAYHICISKSRYLTEFLASRRPAALAVKLFSTPHYFLYQKALQRSRDGIGQKSRQVALNNFITRAADRAERLSKSQNQIEYAKALDYILKRAELKIHDRELIVGNASSERVGAPLHADLGGLLMLPELDDLPNRKDNPIQISEDQKRLLREKIFPFWFNRSVLSKTPAASSNKQLFNTLLDGRFFILTQFAGISHVTPDYPTVLKLGFNGIRTKIENEKKNVDRELSRKKVSGKEKKQLEEKRDFYIAGSIAAEAAIAFAERWTRNLRRAAADEKDLTRRAELERLADALANAPANPAKSFYEAVQSVFLVHTMLHQESFQHGISFGRMDKYLYPYFEADITAGIISREEAVEILGCFIAKAGELLPLFFERATEYFSGLSSASGITLGGSSPDGVDETNELSQLFLLAYDQIRLRQPNFHVRLHPKTNRDFRALCYETLKKGGGIPAFFNDEKIIPALENLGVENTDAHDYSVVGCVEWGIGGKSFPAAGAAFINLPMALALALNDGVFDGRRHGPKTGQPESFKNIDQVVAAFEIQLNHLISQAVEGNNAIEKTHARHRPTPLLSILIDGCIRSGREVNDGGAKYNSTGCQGVGLADVVDSLAAIDRVVFKDKKLTIRELNDIAADNFADQQPVRLSIINKIPKYGQSESAADKLLNRISAIYSETVLKFDNPRGGKYWPGFWSMTTHHGFGSRMPATPSGRPAGEPFANGCSPCNGRDKFGPTASLSSASSLACDKIGNGYALNQKIDVNFLAGERGNDLLDSLVYGYFSEGGMQVQFNILDAAMLRAARDNPDNWRDLVVRVSGYSAYFNDLTEAMKDEIIARTVHLPDSGSCCST